MIVYIGTMPKSEAKLLSNLIKNRKRKLSIKVIKRGRGSRIECLKRNPFLNKWVLFRDLPIKYADNVAVYLDIEEKSKNEL